MTKHTPATPLPWSRKDGHFQHVMGLDIDYFIHAANAYPRQVIAARELLEALDREHSGELGVEATAAANRLDALLRELGEE